MSLALACAARAEVSLESRRATFQAQVDGTVSNCLAVRKQADVDAAQDLDPIAAQPQLMTDQPGGRPLPGKWVAGGMREPNGIAIDPSILKEQSAVMSERIDALEARAMFQDETIETLNRTVTAQWLKIDALTRQLAALSDPAGDAEVRFGEDGQPARLADHVHPAATERASEEELRRIIRDAGFKPVQRDTLYRTMFLN